MPEPKMPNREVPDQKAEKDENEVLEEFGKLHSQIINFLTAKKEGLGKTDDTEINLSLPEIIKMSRNLSEEISLVMEDLLTKEEDKYSPKNPKIADLENARVMLNGLISSYDPISEQLIISNEEAVKRLSDQHKRASGESDNTEDLLASLDSVIEENNSK